MSEDNIQTVLSDIINTPGSSNYIQSNISCLSYNSKLTLSPSVQPTSQSVNQKKSVKRSASQIRQVATDLCSRVNTPVYESQNHHFIEVYYPSGNPPVMPNRIFTIPKMKFQIECQRRYVGVANLDHNIVEILKECLDKHNCVVKNYRKAGEIIKENVIHDVSIRLIRSSNSIGLSKQYSMTTTSELAALIVGDFDNSYTKRDIIVKRQCGKLQRIDELHMAYLPLQYPLLFPYGDNGYDSSNQHALESLSKQQKEEETNT
ncbi:hypothetical protein K1719_033257 [Acacia pycnantha]|nr:hypothetical protein K1719_033257 [Acacia pycnantha]